jgi:predicted Zn-dependent protease
MRQAQKAREDLAELTARLQATPDDADLPCQIAQVFLRYGDEQEGIRWLLTNLQNHPQHAGSHLALADYYVQHGQLARAEEHRRLADTPP